jgi:hypothetical protein
MRLSVRGMHALMVRGMIARIGQRNALVGSALRPAVSKDRQTRSSQLHGGLDLSTSRTLRRVVMSQYRVVELLRCSKFYLPFQLSLESHVCVSRPPMPLLQRSRPAE